MNEEITFSYSYSAEENKEVQEIRKRYLPQKESKFEELKRLDYMVRMAGQMQSLCIGCIGCLVFGIGMCFAMRVIGNSMALGIVIGLVGSVIMFCAYPVFQSISNKARDKFVPRILELIDELTAKV